MFTFPHQERIMSCRTFLRFAGVIAVSFSLAPTYVQAGGGCGCEAPGSTVYHVHSRCHHHCRHSPPVGMLVPSAPMMAAPMMAAPMMAAPVMMTQAPVMQVAAPTVALAPAQTFSLATVQAAPQATLQLSMPQQTTCGGSATITQDQLVRALSQAMESQANGGARAAAAPSGSSVEDRLADLERRVGTLETATKDIVGLIRDMKAGK
jgi:hypothetical protein